MRYKQTTFQVLIVCCLALAGCDHYLDVTPKGYTLLTTVNNYEQWLNDANVLGQASQELNLLADNVDNVNIPVPPASTTELAYTWALQFSTDLNNNPILWGNQYEKINKYNTVIQGIDQATGGTEQQKRALKAEALLGRAYEYLCLINEYGKPYDPATAGQDPGVPFVTSNDVAQPAPPRSSVQEIYDHILADIQTSIPDLPADNSNNRLRASVAAAYSVLARVYLYIGNYEEASDNAQLALEQGNATMLDYRGTLPARQISVRADALYARMLSVGYETPAISFLQTFAADDLRLKLLYSSTDNYTGRGNTQFFPLVITSALQSSNCGTTVQEMKLIVAEAAARSGDVASALQQLDEVRINRFPATSYQRLQSDSQEEVLGWVLKERTLEFPFHGLRWFDMRRYDRDGTMPAVNRYDAQGNVIATLSPHSPRYTLQIPVQVLQFNPGMEQNPQ